MVNTGTSCDIMYSRMFKTLLLTKNNLSPYGSKLYGFNGSSTNPYGYVEKLITFGQGGARKTVKVEFLGRPTMAELRSACLTSHLKLKYHAKDDTITICMKTLRLLKDVSSKLTKVRPRFPNQKHHLRERKRKLLQDSQSSISPY